jgi:hypothetical protein
MASADEFRRYAEECVALAHGMLDPADKARLLQVAQAWRDLADKHDRMSDDD